MNDFPKVVIGLPSGGFVRTETLSCLVYMLAETPCQYQMSTPVSCYIHMNRIDIVKQSIAVEAEWILFVDGDMCFPPDALKKLFSLNKDIASVTYNFRKYPLCSVVKLHDDYDSDYQDVDPNVEKPIPLDKIRSPFRVGAAGTGFMLIKVDVFKKLDQPWFFFEAEDESIGKQPVGEDIWFCNKAREKGYEIWVDPSIKVGHVGTVIF
jgi:GT2 family glycosyltransferase